MIWGYPILRNVHLPNYLRNAANKIIEKPFPIFLIHSCAFQIKASLSIAFNHMFCFEIELQPPSKSPKRSTKPQEALGRCTPQHVPWLWILAPVQPLESSMFEHGVHSSNVFVKIRTMMINHWIQVYFILMFMYLQTNPLGSLMMLDANFWTNHHWFFVGELRWQLFQASRRVPKNRRNLLIRCNIFFK